MRRGGRNMNYERDNNRRRSNFQMKRHNHYHHHNHNNYYNNNSQYMRKPKWDNMRLDEIRKDFYRPHPDVIKRGKDEVENWRSKNEIILKGHDIPPPYFSFNEPYFPPAVIDAIQRNNITTPTLMQSQGWSIMLNGRDMLGVEETGSGKILSYILPALVHINHQPYVRKGEGPIALVLVPTRELAQQIQQVITDYGQTMRVKSACIFGGSSKNYQASALIQGIEILIATPGRLLDFLQSQRTNLRRCTYLILDDIDHMIELRLEQQIRKILEQIRPDRQTCIFAANLTNDVVGLAKDYLKDYIQLNISSNSNHLSIGNRNILQIVDVCLENEKEVKLNILLREILTEKENKSIIIFIDNKRRADEVYKKIKRDGWSAITLHGDFTHDEKDNLLQNFRSGKSPILATTDATLKGLDIDDVKFVINYDYPEYTDDYINRIKRTGGRENIGTAYTFFTQQNASKAADLVGILKNSKQIINPKLQEIADLNKPIGRNGESRDGGGRQDRRSYRSRSQSDDRTKNRKNGRGRSSSSSPRRSRKRSTSTSSSSSSDSSNTRSNSSRSRSRQSSSSDSRPKKMRRNSDK